MKITAAQLLKAVQGLTDSILEAAQKMTARDSAKLGGLTPLQVSATLPCSSLTVNSAATTLDCSQATVWDLTVGQDTTISFLKVPTVPGHRTAIVLTMHIGTVAPVLTWVPGLVWVTDGGVAPTLAPNSVVEVTLTTVDGLVWIGRALK